MTEQYRLATLEDAEQLQAVTVDAYETIRALNIPFPAGHATLEVIQNNIVQHECYILEKGEKSLPRLPLIEPKMNSGKPSAPILSSAGSR